MSVRRDAGGASLVQVCPRCGKLSSGHGDGDVSESQIHDCFLSHAREDKAELVEPLVQALESRGISVWFDAHQIRLGDDIRQRIEEGLRSSRFGVVVLSPSFRKYWPEAELSALFARESLFEGTRILPVVHAMTLAESAMVWPLLASRAAIFSWEGVDAVADAIARAVGKGEASSPATGISNLYGVPRSPSVEFVGRSVELDQIQSLMRRADAIRIAASVEGLAGIGKTELALQLVHRLGAAGLFPGGIFWFDAEAPDLTTAWGTTIADALGLPQGPLASRAQLAVRTVSRRGVPTLIVLDNVEHWNARKSPEPLPEGTHLRFLLTTRRRSLGGNQFQHYELGVLAPEYSRRLLSRTAKRELATEPGHEALLAYLDGHALALELAGAFLSEYPEETPESYLEALRAGKPVEAGVTDLIRYDRTVAQAFRTVWARRGRRLQRSWALAACFEPEFASPALADAVGLDTERLRELRRFHLTETAAEGRWRMHRLTRDFGRRAVTEKGRRASRTAFVRGAIEYCEPIEFGVGYKLYLPDRPHLDTAVTMASVVLEDTDPLLAHFQSRIGTGLHSAGDFAGAEELKRAALDSGLLSVGPESPEVAKYRANLGWLLRDMGRSEQARSLLEEALASNLRALGEDHPDVARCRSQLGTVLKDLGDLPAARKYLEQALASDLASFGEDHPTVAIRRSQLGIVLKGIGDLPAARRLAEQALATGRRLHGDEHPFVAVYRTNLGVVHQAEGDLEEAERLLQQALSTFLETIGEEHPNTLLCREKLELLHAEREEGEPRSA